MMSVTSNRLKCINLKMCSMHVQCCKPKQSFQNCQNSKFDWISLPKYLIRFRVPKLAKPNFWGSLDLDHCIKSTKTNMQLFYYAINVLKLLLRWTYICNFYVWNLTRTEYYFFFAKKRRYLEATHWKPANWLRMRICVKRYVTVWKLQKFTLTLYAKNSVKARFYRKSWYWVDFIKYFFSESESLVSSHCAIHSVEICHFCCHSDFTWN